ncbi:MAG: GDCCVxC domain-containing (seleno)protein [Burkholderiaceae bacterium]|nr:GDCCVxC domain-containing (seleno)protein [Burkholderiaceae bacterium]
MNRGCSTVVVVTNNTLEPTLTCPECGLSQVETMPTEACQWFYECTQCHAALKPLPGTVRFP